MRVARSRSLSWLFVFLPAVPSLCFSPHAHATPQKLIEHTTEPHTFEVAFTVLRKLNRGGSQVPSRAVLAFHRRIPNNNNNNNNNATEQKFGLRSETDPFSEQARDLCKTQRDSRSPSEYVRLPEHRLGPVADFENARCRASYFHVGVGMFNAPGALNIPNPTT